MLASAGETVHMVKQPGPSQGSQGNCVVEKRAFDDIPAIVADIAAEQASDGGPNLYAKYWASYRGRYFDVLARRSNPWRFNEVDFVALNMLSVRLDPQGIATLLFDIRVADEATRLLRLIPTCTPLHKVDYDAIGPGSAPEELWQLLREEVRGVGSGLTVITKLMAAKRPHLFPVWDSRIDDAIELPAGQLWEPMHTLVCDREARWAMDDATSAHGSRATLLRRIDSALWLYGDRQHGGTSQDEAVAQ